MMQLGKKMSEIRAEKGISLEELSLRSGIPAGTINKISAGITVNPSFETVCALAKGLGCSISELTTPDQADDNSEIESGSTDFQLRIKEARKRAGHSQKNLAALIGVSPSTLVGYESYARCPRPETLVKIAKSCHCTIDYLMGYSENPLESGIAQEFDHALTEPSTVTIGEIINRAKKAKGMTNIELANATGITLSNIDKITSGVNDNPTLDTLKAICSVLGLSLSDFDDSESHKNRKTIPVEAEAAAEENDLWKEFSSLLASISALVHHESLSAEDLHFLSGIVKLLNTWLNEKR